MLHVRRSRSGFGVMVGSWLGFEYKERMVASATAHELYIEKIGGASYEHRKISHSSYSSHYSKPSPQMDLTNVT